MGFLPSDPEKQKKLLIALVPILGLVGYWYFVHGKRAEEIQAMQTRMESLESANKVARTIAAQGGPELEKRLALYEQHMVRLEELIPTREEVPELLHTLTLRARDAGVNLALMRPEAEEAQEFYSRQSYEMSVVGSYHAVGQFLSEIGSLPRIITPVDLRLVPSNLPGQTKPGTAAVEAAFRIQTYVIPVPGSSEPAPAEQKTNATT
jgi:type IV pilus assembly protein PilO